MSTVGTHLSEIVENLSRSEVQNFITRVEVFDSRHAAIHVRPSYLCRVELVLQCHSSEYIPINATTFSSFQGRSFLEDLRFGPRALQLGVSA